MASLNRPSENTPALTPQSGSIGAQTGCASPTIPTAPILAFPCPACADGVCEQLPVSTIPSWACTHCAHMTTTPPTVIGAGAIGEMEARLDRNQEALLAIAVAGSWSEDPPVLEDLTTFTMWVDRCGHAYMTLLLTRVQHAMQVDAAFVARKAGE